MCVNLVVLRILCEKSHCFLVKFTQLAQILHDLWSWRSRQISTLVVGRGCVQWNSIDRLFLEKLIDLHSFNFSMWILTWKINSNIYKKTNPYCFDQNLVTRSFIQRPQFPQHVGKTLPSVEWLPGKYQKCIWKVKRRKWLQRWYFGCPNQNFKTTFQYKYPP